MIKSKILIKNSIQKKYLDKNYIKKLSKDFQQIIDEVVNDTDKSNKTLNVLNNKFKFNFTQKDLKKFRKFKTIVLIGMGGSILGAEAINNFLKKK